MATQRIKKDPEVVDQMARLISEKVAISFVEVKKRLRAIAKERGATSVFELLAPYMDKSESDDKKLWLEEVALDVELFGASPTPLVTAAASQETPTRAVKTSKRTALRDSLWNDAGERVWQRKKHQGFTTIPKELPLIMNVADVLMGSKMDVSKVYLTLWCNVWDDGFVQVPSPEKLAFEAGYMSKKRGTEWRKRIVALKELGFIDTKPGSSGDDEYVLLLNPVEAVEKLISTRREEIPEAMINALREKSITFGK